MPQPIPTASREPGANLTHGTPTDHPRNELTQHTMPHYATLCRNPRGILRHTLPAGWGEVYIYFPRRGIVSADPLGRVQQRATLPPANGRARGDERREEDGGRTAAD